MSGSDQVVTFGQMKGTIGSLVWLWSQIERELTAAIKAMNSGTVPRNAHGASKSIAVWSEFVLHRTEGRILQIHACHSLVELLAEALAVRNLVCHVLIGISAQVHPTGREAHLTVELGEDRRILTWSELQEMFAWMSQTTRLIRELTTAAMENDAAWGNAMLARWEKFSSARRTAT